MFLHILIIYAIFGSFCNGVIGRAYNENLPYIMMAVWGFVANLADVLASKLFDKEELKRKTFNVFKYVLLVVNILDAISWVWFVLRRNYYQLLIIDMVIDVISSFVNLLESEISSAWLNGNDRATHGRKVYKYGGFAAICAKMASILLATFIIKHNPIQFELIVIIEGLLVIANFAANVIYWKIYDLSKVKVNKMWSAKNNLVNKIRNDLDQVDSDLKRFKCWSVVNGKVVVTNPVMTI